LKFFGDVGEERLNEIRLRLREAAERGTSFSLSVGKFGCFPNIYKPRVLWVGLSDRTKSLDTLHDSLESELASSGFKPEKRRFHPHITVGRVHRRAKPDEIARMRVPLQNFTLDVLADVSIKNIALIRSDLTSSGPIYTLIDEFPLGEPKR
jgi:2'-5' RNA ligase